jgi:glycyl-tRNA synthetase
MSYTVQGIVDNETLGYFIARTYLFLTGIGINKERLRFRQHLQNEMAHYAQDCWDAEIECSYGWFECVGLADRSAFDLKAHTSKSGVELVAHEVFDNPKDVEQLTILPNKKILGKVFRKDQKILSESLQSMNEAEALALKAELEEKEKTIYRVCTTGQEFELTKEMVTISQQVVKTHGRNFTPSVIEPSFGVGRIMYCLYEHCFYTRPYTPGEQVSSVFRFPPLIAPIKCTVFPLIQREILNLKAKQISNSLTRVGVSNKMDVTGRSIGKRYARTDEVGIPFAITVDFDEGVTVRERDSKQQIRVPDGEVVDVVRDLANGSLPWAKVTSSYQVVLVPDTEAES